MSMSMEYNIWIKLYIQTLFQIDIDYSALFPDQNIYFEFEKKSDKIYNILGEKVKDSSCLKILDQIKNGDNLNESKYKKFILILILKCKREREKRIKSQFWVGKWY